jgi:2-polyprenyl-3-methyl-5-hydroxy-6-metoxy-1,4-benzoquinol methylase
MGTAVSDFRTQLYERYVSTFKSPSGAEDQANLRSHREWCRFKVLPLLGGVNRAGPLLELGCGSGNLLRLLADEGFGDVLGIDVSEEMVARARARGIEARCGDAVAFLAGDTRSYGAIVALDFLEHFSKEELLDLLPRIHARLAPGGLLLIQTPNGQGLLPHQVIYGDLTHLTIFTPDSLAQLLRLFGFEAIACHETGPVPKSAIGVARVVLWQLIRGAATIVRKVETGRTQRIWTENLLCTCRRGPLT